MRFRHHLLIATLLLAAHLSFAAAERGVMVRVAQIYLSPDTNAPRIATIDRGPLDERTVALDPRPFGGL